MLISDRLYWSESGRQDLEYLSGIIRRKGLFNSCYPAENNLNLFNHDHPEEYAYPDIPSRRDLSTCFSEMKPVGEAYLHFEDMLAQTYQCKIGRYFGEITLFTLRYDREFIVGSACNYGLFETEIKNGSERRTGFTAG